MQHTSSNIAHSKSFSIRIAAGLVVLSIICFFSLPARAQMPFPPPSQLQVFYMMGLNFGSFYPGSTTGTVTISPNGNRTSSGLILDMGNIGHQAIFDVLLLPGRLVSMSWQSTVTLSNGSYSLSMQIGPTDKIATSPTSAEFVTSSGSPFRNQVNFGGTLTVGSISVNPPGDYSGTFEVTFHQN
jgi:hypothetical protein